MGNAWDESLSTLWGRLGVYRETHLEGRFSELPERCQTCKDWMTGAADKIPPAAVGEGPADLDKGSTGEVGSRRKK